MWSGRGEASLIKFYQGAKTFVTRLYSLSWGLDEYQEVTNRGIRQQKTKFVKVG